MAPTPDQWLSGVQNDDAIIMVDGYHGFGAIPTDWSAYANRVFYLAGGYKYAQAGEGCCFAVVPSAHAFRPEYTGWYADFGNLANTQEGLVAYADDGMAMAGATTDLSALYRLDAVLTLWQKEGLTPERIHQHVQLLKQAFLRRIDELNNAYVHRENLLENGLEHHGHFFTFRWGTAEDVATFAAHLREHGVLTDQRENRLRFGFSLYHEASDYQQISF